MNYGAARIVERINEDRFLDACIDLNAPDPLLAGGDGDGPLWMFAGALVDVMNGRKYYGVREVDANGVVVEITGDDFSASGFVAGFKFTARARQYLPNIDEGEARGQRITRRKVKKATVHVRDATEFEFQGRTFAGYKANDPGEADPPLWSGAFSGPVPWPDYDPETIWEKSVPGPCTVLEIAGSVTV
ncbi:MAG: hypothetical protein IPK23_15130 [Rhizobiales bacterium]|nr:hypothetical protein [Hyphomicrobiales bacterium]